MIANNIFRIIGDIFVFIFELLYDPFRSMEGWWSSNTINIIIFTLSTIALIYWLNQMVKHSKDPNAL